jgi:AcrR family transcriptional regulator
LATKAEQGLATRQGIVAAATRLFAEHGYAGVPIEAVLAATGLSRGALYHHYAGKEALFEAVVEAVETDVCQKVIARSAGARDAARALVAGGEAFLELAQDPAVRQIVLIDAPSVLGWAKWREIEARYGFGLLKASLARAAAEGALAPDKVEIFAHILLAALGEVALVIAKADDRNAASAEAKAAMGTLLAAMLTPTRSSS